MEELIDSEVEQVANGKMFILDTSAIVALVQDITTFSGGEWPRFAGVLGDNEIIIPQAVLDELHELRRASDERSLTALEAARQLEHYSGLGSLIDGVETEKGGSVRIAPRPNRKRTVAWGLDPDIPDHEILATALDLQHTLGPEAPIVLITQDRIMRVLARGIYQLDAEELKSVCASELEYERGYHRIALSSDEIDSVISQGVYTPEFVPTANEFFHLVDRENPDVHYCYATAEMPREKKAHLIDRSKVDFLKVAGEVSGRNVRQKLLLWALMGGCQPDPMEKDATRLITISGPAGSGKSYLTLAAAWERLERGHFERIVVTRPMVDVGPSMGFLPGSLEEKIRPWEGPIEDNLRAIVQVPSPDEGRGGSKRGYQRNNRPFDAKAWLEMEDRLEMVPLTYIRGRTFRRSFVILEEAQNLERGPLKVLLTRLGEGSMVVVIGDKSQIDNQFLSTGNNGLVHAINAFRNWPQAVHMHLTKIERSDIAEAATQLL